MKLQETLYILEDELNEVDAAPIPTGGTPGGGGSPPPSGPAGATPPASPTAPMAGGTDPNAPADPNAPPAETAQVPGEVGGDMMGGGGGMMGGGGGMGGGQEGSQSQSIDFSSAIANDPEWKGIIKKLGFDTDKYRKMSDEDIMELKNIVITKNPFKEKK
jgi:hypothetical protein